MFDASAMTNRPIRPIPGTTNAAGYAVTDSPLWPAAAGRMKIDVAVGEDCKVWVVHDKPFPEYLEWIEFDVPSGRMTFITKGGKLQDLGLTIHPPMDSYVAQARDVRTVWVDEKGIRDMGLLTLLVRKG